MSFFETYGVDPIVLDDAWRAWAALPTTRLVCAATGAGAPSLPPELVNLVAAFSACAFEMVELLLGRGHAVVASKFADFHTRRAVPIEKWRIDVDAWPPHVAFVAGVHRLNSVADRGAPIGFEAMTLLARAHSQGLPDATLIVKILQRASDRVPLPRDLANALDQRQRGCELMRTVSAERLAHMVADLNADSILLDGMASAYLSTIDRTNTSIMRMYSHFVTAKDHLARRAMFQARLDRPRPILWAQSSAIARGGSVVFYPRSIANICGSERSERRPRPGNMAQLRGAFRAPEGKADAFRLTLHDSLCPYADPSGLLFANTDRKSHCPCPERAMDIASLQHDVPGLPLPVLERHMRRWSSGRVVMYGPDRETDERDVAHLCWRPQDVAHRYPRADCARQYLLEASADIGQPRMEYHAATCALRTPDGANLAAYYKQSPCAKMVTAAFSPHVCHWFAVRVCEHENGPAV